MRLHIGLASGIQMLRHHAAKDSRRALQVLADDQVEWRAYPALRT